MLSRSLAPSTTEEERRRAFCCSRWRPACERRRRDRGPRSGQKLLAERGIQRVRRTGQPVGTRGDRSARGRLPNNNKLAPLDESRGPWGYLSLSLPVRPYVARSRRSGSSCFALIRVPSSRYSIDSRRDIYNIRIYVLDKY